MSFGKLKDSILGLFTSHLGWLYEDCLQKKCLIWMNGNVEDGEDAFSQITLKAWEQLFLYADRVTHLQAWLMRFAYNVCMDIHRAKKKKGDRA